MENSFCLLGGLSSEKELEAIVDACLHCSMTIASPNSAQRPWSMRTAWGVNLGQMALSICHKTNKQTNKKPHIVFLPYVLSSVSQQPHLCVGLIKPFVMEFNSLKNSNIPICM
jgi:hypothetical protein